MLEISFTEMCTSNSLCLSPKAFWIPWSPDSHLWDWNSGKPSRISSNTFHMHQIVSEGLAKQLMKALNRSSSNNQRAHWVISCNGFSGCAIRSYPQPSLRQRRRKGGMWFAKSLICDFGVQFPTTFVRFIYFVLMIEQSFTPGNVYIRFALFSFRWVLQTRVLMSSRYPETQWNWNRNRSIISWESILSQYS